MERGFQGFVGKYVYIILKNKRVYSGRVTEIDDSGKPLIFMFLLDKYGKIISFLTSEIEVIEEENKEGK